MYCIIVCPECGKCLACVYDIFMKMRRDRIEEHLQESFVDIDPFFLQLYEMQGVKFGDILDDLNIKVMCCRVHMIAQVEIRELLQ